MVGFDGSPAADRALERAASLLAADGSVVVITASPSVPATGPVDEPILDSPSPEQRGAMLERAADMLRSRGVETTLVAADAEPADALTQAARAQGADLIVVGALGSGYVTRAIIGSTAEKVIRQAPCDVLVVR